MKVQLKVRRVFCQFLALAALLGAGETALAGQSCEPRRPTIESMRDDLALAASVARQLDEFSAREGSTVWLIARAGQDLSRYGLRYSHLGIAYRDAAALEGRGAWRVVHKLNQCGSSRGELYRQGLAEFFGDGLFLREAGVVALKPALAIRIVEALKDNATVSRLHESRYNMLAYPWSGPYQQSNQWAIETLAMLSDPAVLSRTGARDWLRRQGYQPTTLELDAVTRLGARISTAHISFDDHPFGRRMAGQIDTVTVDSVFAWMERAGLGAAPLRLTARPADIAPAPQIPPQPAPAKRVVPVAT